MILTLAENLFLNIKKNLIKDLLIVGRELEDLLLQRENSLRAGQEKSGFLQQAKDARTAFAQS